MTIKQFNHVEKLVEKLNYHPSQVANVTLQILKQCKEYKTNPLHCFIDKAGFLVLND